MNLKSGFTILTNLISWRISMILKFYLEDYITYMTKWPIKLYWSNDIMLPYFALGALADVLVRMMSVYDVVVKNEEDQYHQQH